MTPDELAQARVRRARVRRALDMEARARDFRLLDIPSYRAWSSRKLREGESEALIAHLDATCMWLLPEEVEPVKEASFDELLEDLRADIDDQGLPRAGAVDRHFRREAPAWVACRWRGICRAGGSNSGWRW